MGPSSNYPPRGMFAGMLSWGLWCFGRFVINSRRLVGFLQSCLDALEIRANLWTYVTMTESEWRNHSSFLRRLQQRLLLTHSEVHIDMSSISRTKQTTVAHFRFAAAFKACERLPIRREQKAYGVAVLELQKLSKAFILVDSIEVLRYTASKYCRLAHASHFS